MQQSPEWAYVRRSQGPYRVVQKHKTVNQGSLEGERKAAKLFGYSVFPICTQCEKKITLIISHCL